MDERDEHIAVMKESIAFSEGFVTETYQWERSTKRWQIFGWFIVALEIAFSGYSLGRLVVEPNWISVFVLILHLAVLALWVRIQRRNKAHLKWIQKVRQEVSEDITHMKAVLIEVRETGEFAEWMAEFPGGGGYTDHP